ncbi:MAG: phage major tail tube protein [Lachnospiraceae bacterium]|nr:phage major tail tube protein [Lachnospiraceae bacterium]MBP3296945.1 phage major tail tube protein [Lachnospiraceae bacterium]MBR6849788.1 phage major tail tube protein [Lachnospiraceae bacterium]
MEASNIPEVINNYNAYSNGNKLIGVTGEVQLPDLEAITETISGAGVLGEYETSIPGHYSSITQEVPFRILDTDIFSLMNPLDPVDLTFRASEQYTKKESGSIDYRGMRIVERGRLKNFTPGKLAIGKQMDAKVTLEVLYLLVEIDGETKLEYDKLNSVFVVNGKDLLEKVRAYT